MFGLSLHIFSPNSTLLCWYNLLVVRFPQVVVPPNWARKDFADEVHLLGKLLQIASFFPNSILFQMHPKNFWCVPPKRSIPILQLIGAELWDTQTWTFFFSSQKSNCSLSTLFSTSRWGCSYHQLVDTSNDSHECVCFQTCNHDTRGDVDKHTMIFFILSTKDKGFSAWVVGLAFRLFKLFPSVCVFHFRYRRVCLLLGENFLRISTSFHTSVSSWTRPNCCLLKTFISLPLGVRIVRPFPFIASLYANLCSEILDPALKFYSVREILMDLRVEITGIVMPLEYKSKYPRHGKS